MEKYKGIICECGNDEFITVNKYLKFSFNETTFNQIRCTSCHTKRFIDIRRVLIAAGIELIEINKAKE